MKSSTFEPVSTLRVAILISAFVANLASAAHSQAPKQSGKKQPELPARVRGEVKEETIDLVPDIKDKKFTDGKHLLRTLPSGLKISIVTKSNQVTDVLFADRAGKEEKGVEKQQGAPAARKKGAGAQTAQPPCIQIICHGSTTKVIGPDGQIESETTTNTCVRVPCPITANPFANDPVSEKGAHGSGVVSTSSKKPADQKEEPPFKKP